MNDTPPRLLPCLACCLVVGLLLSEAAVADPLQAPPLAAEAHAGQRPVVSTGITVTGQPIRYPSGASARITAVEITLEPGQETGWHMHPVPLFGYVLEGELTVDYAEKGKHTFRRGEGFVEAVDAAHNGRNTGAVPTKILAVVMGAEGVPASSSAPSPTR